MIHIQKQYWVILCLLIAGSISGAAWAGAPAGQVLHVDSSLDNSNPERLIVKFKDGNMSNYRQFILNNLGITKERDLFNSAISIMKVSSSKPLEQLLEQIRNTGFVEYVEPDYRMHILKTPNDPQYGSLWGLHNDGQGGGRADADIDGPEAWDLHTGNRDVVVGIIDTGVDYTHEDLAANMWKNPGEIAGNGIDDDGNGYVDDIYGIDAHNGDSDPMDDQAHGTHVAGTIGAVGNNGIGVTGVAWNTKIMALKFLDARGSGNLSNALICIDYAVKMRTEYGINVILTSNSWGGGGFSQAMYDAIAASGAAGMLFVAAAGNDSNNNDGSGSYPASYDLPSIISVAATDRNDNMSSFSSYGATTVDLGAPGTDILSTTPGNNYKTYSGTSMATPHVSGAVALVWSKLPGSTAQGVKGLLMNTVDPLDSMQGKVLSGGRLNVANAVSCEPGVPKLILGAPGDDFRGYVDKTRLLSVSIIDCASRITGATVTATPSDGGPVITLKDDGISPDKAANDGQYAANWTPKNIGSVSIEIQATGSFATLATTISGEIREATEYTVNDSIGYDWIDATTGTKLDLNQAKSTVEIPLGFEFDFFGLPYDKVTVTTSGYLTFGSSGASSSNEKIPATGSPNNIIAPYWDKLDAGEVFALVEGTAPNRRLTIEWKNSGISVLMGLVSGTGTFQTTLYEGSNDIKFQYKDVMFLDGFWSFLADVNNGASATVGIEGPFGDLGHQYSYNEKKVSDNKALQFTVK